MKENNNIRINQLERISPEDQRRINGGSCMANEERNFNLFSKVIQNRKNIASTAIK